MTAGLQLLRAAGALSAELGTSSENTAMQRLAEKLGFTHAIVPKANLPRHQQDFPQLTLYGVSSLQEAVDICRRD